MYPLIQAPTAKNFNVYLYHDFECSHLHVKVLFENYKVYQF